jgi:tape measure domain-containing protein
MATPVEYILRLTDQFTGPMRNAEQSANNLESGMDRIHGLMKNMAGVVGTAFAVDKLAQFGKSIIDAGSKVEDATTGLTTLLGDAAAATKVVKDTMEDATKTPFEFEGLLSANQQLIASGVNADKARADVMNLANAVAASGKGNDEFQRMSANLAQISTVGKATAMDIKQFGIAGINVYKVLADYTHKPIEQVKEMEVGYGTLTAALQKAHEKGGIYYNGLENMQKNTSVKISNLGDTIFVSMVDVFQKMKPLTDFVLSGIANGLEWIKEKIGSLDLAGFANTLINGFNSFMEFIKPLFEPIKNLFMTVYNSVKKVWAALSQFSSEGTGLLEGIRTALIYLIDGFTWLYNNIYNTIAMAIDVIHTLWVVLQKLHIVDIFVLPFKIGWAVLKQIGSWIKSFYDSTIKPIVDTVVGVYDKFKSMMGIKDTVEKAKTKTAPKTAENPVQDFIDKGALGKGKTEAMVPTTSKSEASKVTGTKATTINIKIDKLIELFKIETMQMTEGAGRVKELVAQAILEAVRDSQITAGM